MKASRILVLFVFVFLSFGFAPRDNSGLLPGEFIFGDNFETGETSFIGPVGVTPQSVVPMETITGLKKYVNVLCKFSDVSTEEYGASFIQGMFANSFSFLGHYWNTISYGNISIQASSVGWYTLPHIRSYYVPTDGSAPSFTNLTNDCLNLADPYVNFSAFDGVNMFFNGGVNSSWGGQYYLTRDGASRNFYATWIYYYSEAPVAHEMGHNFGWGHSRLRGGTSNYQNVYDVMSDPFSNYNRAGNTYHDWPQGTISYNLDKAGWLLANKKVTLGQNTSASYCLESLLGTPVSGYYKQIIIPVVGSSDYYFVELRDNSSYDYKLLYPGIGVYRVTISSSFVELMSNNPDFSNHPNAVLTAGESMFDRVDKVEVKATSNNCVTVSNKAYRAFIQMLIK